MQGGKIEVIFMEWSQMFAKSKSVDVSGKNQVSVEDVMNDYGTIKIKDFSFCTTSNGDTAFVLFEESPNDFFFAPTVLTNMLHMIDDNDDAREKFDSEGITVEISTTKNKKGNRTYFNFTPVDAPVKKTKKK